MSGSFISSVKSLFSVTDEQAMWRVRMHDDSEAFAHLMGRWETPIRRLCTRMTGDEHCAEDLTQETFSRLFTRRKNYRSTGRFSTFIWRVALNLCYDELRRVRRRTEFPLAKEGGRTKKPLSERIAETPQPDGFLIRQEQADLVRWALQQLAEPHRVVVTLRHYENLKFREIAEILEIPEGTVKSRMAEAMTQLHRFLRPRLLEKDPKICIRPTKPKTEAIVL